MYSCTGTDTVIRALLSLHNLEAGQSIKIPLRNAAVEECPLLKAVIC